MNINEKIIKRFNRKWDSYINKKLSKIDSKYQEQFYKLFSNKKYESYLRLLQDLNIVTNFPKEVSNIDGAFKGTLNLPLDSFESFWLEDKEKVFDITLGLVFPKEIYYNLYNPSDIKSLVIDDDLKQIVHIRK